MKKIDVRFEKDERIDGVEVVIRASRQDADVRSLMEQLSGKAPETLTLTETHGKTLTLVVDDIISVSVDDKLTMLTTHDGRYSIRLSLGTVESMLDSSRFVRISRHELVNLDKILRYDFTVDGTLRLELAGGVETWASRRCIPVLRKRLDERE